MVIMLGLPFILTSCGNGGGYAGGGIGGTGSYAGGGIGGTGTYSGPVTAIGSVTVNGTKINTDSAQFTVDGITNATLNDIEIGMKVVIETANGMAETVVYESEVAGPVEMVNVGDKILEVMGQTVYVDSLAGTTTFQGFIDLANLQVGDEVTVSGLFDADGNIHAGFIELVTLPLQIDRVKGGVQSLDTEGRIFKLSQLTVDYNGIQDPGLQNGSFVNVEGDYQGNLTLFATTLDSDTPAPPANPGWDMDIEGIITLAPPDTPSNEFELNGQRVQINGQTTFASGTAGDIAINVRVTVKGTVNDSGVLIAGKVEFH